jgi:hypothetical protein
MAKKKTTKAAAKKKAAAKSTEEKKKTTAKKKSTAKKTSVKKTSTAKKTSAAKTSKKAPASKTKKSESVTKAKFTLKELLERKFEHPDDIVVEPAPKHLTYDAIPDAPPFFNENDSKEKKRLKDLLMQTIDIKNIPPPKPEPKKNVPIAELIRQKYAVSPKSLWKPPQKDINIPDPPPFIDASDSEKQANIRSLLFQKISLKNIQSLIEATEDKKSERTSEVRKKDRPALPVSELLKNTYPAWPPQSVVSAPEKKQANIPDPPPFAEGSPDTIRRIRELILKKIDLTDIPETVPTITEKETAKVVKKDSLETLETKAPVIEEALHEEKESIPSEAPEEVPETDQPDELITPESDYSDYTLAPDKDTQLMSNSLKCVFAGILVLFILLYMASSSNHKKYYLVDGKSGVELWQGSFSPMGKSHIITLMGMEIPDTEQDFYSESEIYPLICGFYLDQASEVLSQDNIPNLVQVREYLLLAHHFATEENQQKIQKRLNSIDFMMFVLRADMAIQKGSENELEKAREYIEEAKDLAEKNYQKDMIKNRLQMIDGIKAVNEPDQNELQSKTDDADDSKKDTQTQDKAESHSLDE